MIGLDTTVVVRYLMQDEPEQAEIATRPIDALTDRDPAFVSVATLAEIHWVLRRAYKVDRDKDRRRDSRPPDRAGDPG